MIRKKSKYQNQPQPSQIYYDENQEPMIFMKPFSDAILSHPHYDKLIALYYFLYYTAKWQKTNQPKATSPYIAKGIKWGIRSVKKYKRMLSELGLIENVRIIDQKTKRVKGWYVKLNFIPKKATVQKCHSVENIHPNALSTNNINASSTGNKLQTPKLNGNTPPIKYFKTYLPKEYLKNKELIPTIKEFIGARKDMNKPLTPRAIKIICNRCKKFKPKEVLSAFEIAVINNNQGVFPKEEQTNYRYQDRSKKDQHAPNAVRKDKNKKYREYDEVME